MIKNKIRYTKPADLIEDAISNYAIHDEIRYSWNYWMKWDDWESAMVRATKHYVIEYLKVITNPEATGKDESFLDVVGFRINSPEFYSAVMKIMPRGRFLEIVCISWNYVGIFLTFPGVSRFVSGIYQDFLRVSWHFYPTPCVWAHFQSVSELRSTRAN